MLLDLKRSGARVALDDIGSAYSSLLRMKELPVDGIKLDRRFLNGLDHEPKELRFLMHLIDLSETLGINMIAEGIETAPCLDALAALGIQLAQGYLIATPMGMKKSEPSLGQYRPTPWTGPTTPLGAVALQLRELSIVGRIIDQILPWCTERHSSNRGAAARMEMDSAPLDRVRRNCFRLTRSGTGRWPPCGSNRWDLSIPVRFKPPVLPMKKSCLNSYSNPRRRMRARSRIVIPIA